MPTAAPAAPRPWAWVGVGAFLGGAAWVALLDGALPLRSQSAATRALLAVATWGHGALWLILLAPLALAVAWVLARLVPARLGGWVRARARAWMGALALGGLAAAAVVHWVNATQYVRLYERIHLALTLLTLLSAAAGAGALAWLAAPETTSPSRARAVAVPGLLLLSGLFAGAVALALVVADTRLRTEALERTTALGSELRLLHELTGVLNAGPIEDHAGFAEAFAEASRTRPVPPPSAALPRTNVLLITIDSMRADRWLAGGAKEPRLPTLERLASGAVRFANAYAPSCWTIHSMSAVLWGRPASAMRFAHVGVTSLAPTFEVYPDHSELVQNPLHRKKVTPAPFEDQGPSLVSALTRAGYQTATVVPYVYYFRAAGVTRHFEVVDEDAFRKAGLGASGLAPVPMVERAARFLDTRDPARPFFLWLHFMDAHAPYLARDAAAKGAGDEARYDSELRAVDAELGRLEAALRQRGLLDQVTWVVHADHGEEFRDHGGAFHAATLYDEVIRVPLFVLAPAAAGFAPRTVPEPVSLLDLAPTLLDLTGARAEADMTGASLVPALRGDAPPDRAIPMECHRFGVQKRGLVRGHRQVIVDQRLGTLEQLEVGVR